MAGHFVMWRLSTDIFNNYIVLPGITWSPLQHAVGVANGAGGFFAGWAPPTRDDLNRVRSGTGIPSRNNLPPHRYLGVNAGGPLPALAAQLLNDKFGWITELERPSSPGFGVAALCPAAAAAWSAGQGGYKYDALLAQIAHGATSIEVYYLGGKEIT